MKHMESVTTYNREAIENWINEVLVRYRERKGNISLPIDEKILITAIEELKGIKIELKEKKKVSVHKNEGILAPKRGGFVLEYGLDTYNGKEKYANVLARRRFTICHELGHIFFYSYDNVIPKIFVTPREDVCHEIARKLLLPEEAVKRKFREQYDSNNKLVSFLRKFGREAKVSLYPLTIRLTEELSLLKDAMITFWKFNDKGFQPKIHYGNFIADSKTCPELRKLLPRYWRRCVHVKAWNEVVKNVVTNGTPILKNSLCIEGKRRKNGRLRSMIFDIECETLVDLSEQQRLLKWMNQNTMYNAISVEKFDLRTLEKGR